MAKSVWLALRSLLVLLRVGSLKNWKGPLKRLLSLWQYLKQLLWRARGEGGGTMGEPRDECTEVRCVGSAVVRRNQASSHSIDHANAVVICESRRPLSALELQLNHPHGQFLQPGDIPPRPSSMIVPDRSPTHSTFERLHPYSYHPNGSKSSNISISVQSTSRGRPFEVAERRPDARPTSRAEARGIMRVATRAHSRATSRSRSRAPSRTPALSVVNLPPSTPPPPPPAVTASGSQHTLALPQTDVAPHTPETIPSISLPVTLPVTHTEKIYPVAQSQRYDDCPTVPTNDGTITITPIMTHFPLEGVPPEWTAHTHPEGRLYFYHPDKHIYTDMDVRDHEILLMLEDFTLQIQETIETQELVLPPDYDLVLSLEKRWSTTGYNRIYYFADHTSQSLFWVQECDSLENLDLGEVLTLNTPYDLRLELQSRYWHHIETYPYGHEIKEEIFTELGGMLLYSSLDVVTSMTTTVPYRSDDVYRMLTLVKHAKAHDKSDQATSVIGRLMSIWLHHRFINFYGQTHARLSRDQRVYDSGSFMVGRRTAFIRTLAPFFWNAPNVHLRALEKIWIDDLISLYPWEAFIAKLQGEWQEFVLYGTVLLNANVAFLAIPSVDNGNGQITGPQVCSYVSIATSVGSILLGLLLVRQHRVKAKERADEANHYLKSHKHVNRGLETLAIIYSLPYALLMWGMVTFLLAFTFGCFSTTNKPTIFITAASCIAIAVLVSWTIITGWEAEERSSWLAAKHNVSNFWEPLLSKFRPPEIDETMPDAGTADPAEPTHGPSDAEKAASTLWERRTLADMAAHLHGRLPPFPPANAGDLQPGVVRMLEGYLEGQREISRALNAFAREKEARAVERARGLELDLVDGELEEEGEGEEEK